MNLLLLTKFYPYGNGEAFLENEIGILATYFKKVVIIACEVPPNEKRMRNLPENISSYRISADKKWKDLLSGLRYAFSSDPLLVEEYKHCRTLFQRLFLGYFEAKSQRIYRSLPPVPALDEDPFILYSYWLFTTARVGMLIAHNQLPQYRISRAHRYDLYTEKSILNYLPYRSSFLEAYDLVLPCSDNGTAYLRHRYPDCSQKIQTAYLGTTDHGVGAVRDHSRFVIVSCSRISPEKRVWRIVDALEKLEKPMLKVEWIHIGGGKKLEELKRYAGKKLKHTAFRFLGDIPNTQVMQIYQETGIDLFLNVSSSEGLPVSIMEVMSFGIPVVATDVGGTSEIVIDGRTGRLLPQDYSDPQLTAIIQEFIAMKIEDRYYQYRQTCREIWEQNFRAENNYRNLWQNVCDGRSSDESIRNRTCI